MSTSKASSDLIHKIRFYTRKYNSKIDAANKLGLPYYTVLVHTKDIRINRELVRNNYGVASSSNRSCERYERGIHGKALVLLKELISQGYAFPSKKYAYSHVRLLQNMFPSIRRVRMFGRVIYFIDERAKEAATSFLSIVNKRVVSFQELKEVSRVFDLSFSNNEKNQFRKKKK